MRLVLASLLVSLTAFAAPAFAQDDEELGDLDVSEYPMQLVRRPLVLAEGMLEIQLGAMLDHLSASSGDHIATRADLSWSPFRRGELGVESTLLVAGDFAFAIPDVTGYFEYGVHPTMSLRGEGYLTALRDFGTDELQSSYGVRVALPMQYNLGKKVQLEPTPRWGMNLDTEIQTIDLDVRLAYQVIMPFALYLRGGLSIEDYETEGDAMHIPLGAGAVLHPGRFFDIGAELMLHDVGDEAGRDLRWLTVWIALRH